MFGVCYSYISVELDESNIIVESLLDKVLPDEDPLNGECLLILIIVSTVMITQDQPDPPLTDPDNTKQ